jgi:hypothetical protein
VLIDKIIKLVGACRYGVRYFPDGARRRNGPSRFNMPLELGISAVLSALGARQQKVKTCLVLDREPYRYQTFISDIAGQDISCHSGDLKALVGIVRDWLSTATGGTPMHGGAKIAERFSEFSTELPAIAASFHLEVDELTFKNFANFASAWLQTNLLGSGDPLG